MAGDACPHTPSKPHQTPKYEQEANFCCTSIDTPAQLSGVSIECVSIPDTHRNKKKYLEKYIPNCILDVTLRKRDRIETERAGNGWGGGTVGFYFIYLGII